MKFKDSFHPFAGITILFWSLAFVLTRLILQYFSAFPLGFLRYAVASCALVAIVLTAKIAPPHKADLKWFLLSGFFGFFLYMITFNKGIESVTAATSSVIIATAPVITALLAHIFFKENLTGIQWAATAVEFSGVALLSLMNGFFSLNSGLLWLLLAAISLAIYNLLQRKLTKTYSGLQAAAYSIFSGTIMLAIFLPTALREIRVAPPIQLLYIVILGIFSSAIAYVTWAQALKKAEQTSSVSNYMFITPFLTTLLGFILMNEKPDGSTIAGSIVILMGVLIFNFGDRMLARASRRKRPH